MVWVKEGKIKPPVQHTMPMTSLLEAFDIMDQRAVRGKLVLLND
jgi:D-arabinose 1-dehydrogenase-like Zn-dependent alcohol dehydrogenase